MNIGIVCTGSQPVPPISYGGTQMVNWETANALVEYGHEVYLFAPAGSRTKAHHIQIDDGWGAYIEAENTNKHIAPNIDRLDAIIDTTAFGFPGRAFKQFSYIARMGGDPEKKYCGYFDRNIVFPSTHHFLFHNKNDCGCGKKREEMGYLGRILPKPVCYRATVDKVEDLPFHSKSDNINWYLYLGLIAEHKGTHLAIDFVEKTGDYLMIIGPHDQSDYYEKKIKPRLRTGISRMEAKDNEKKWGYLAQTKAVIFPSTCEEGDPNVPKEALLVGTPVIALDGTVSEIVEDGKTGIICKSVDEMVDRRNEIDKIDSEECRASVLRKFGIDDYIEMTVKLLEKAKEGDKWI
jgi:glycosyltransferase involved in cell wall biosynthesis